MIDPGIWLWRHLWRNMSDSFYILEILEISTVMMLQLKHRGADIIDLSLKLSFGMKSVIGPKISQYFYLKLWYFLPIEIFWVQITWL